MKNNGKYTKDFIEKLKNYYINNDLSLEDMSENSETLFSRHIPTADLKAMSRTDIVPWSILKANNGRKSEDVPVTEKIQKVANKLYDLIIDDENDVSGSQLAQLAKTWSDLIDKAKLTKDTTTAKLPSQQVKDFIDKAIAENK